MKVALIGSYGHQGYAIEGVKDDKNSQVIAVAASEPGENMNTIAGWCDLTAVHDDFRRMLDSEKPDVVSVCPMFYRHQKITVECLKRGISVMCEKPVAMNLEQLSELQSVYEASDGEFIGMHAMRYQPNFRAGYETLQSGIIGKPILISSQKSYAFTQQRPEFYKDRNKFGSSLCWVGIHAMDWTYWMMGPIKELYATHTTFGNQGYESCESSGVIAFRFENCGQGTITFDFLKAHTDQVPQDRCRIAGEKGVIELHSGGAWIATHDEAPTEIKMTRQESIFSAFLRTVRGEQECLVTAADTFAVTRLALLARDSADNGGIRVC